MPLPYNCPGCGAVEPDYHRTDCSLAGVPVAVAFDPPRWAEVRRWHKRNRFVLEREYAGRYVVVNIADFSGAAGSKFEFACKAYKEKFGPPSPPGLGRHFLGLQF